MRTTSQLGLLLCLALTPSCGDRKAADETALPVVTSAPAIESEADTVVEVTRDGRVIFAGEQRSINELLAALAASDSCELRAHPDALWAHVQWVMAALGESGRKTVPCAVEVKGRGAASAFPVNLSRGHWFEKWWCLPYEDDPNQRLPLTVRVRTVPSRAGAEYKMGWDPVTTSADPRSVVRWARSMLGKLKAKQIGVGTIEASGAVSYGAVADALSALHEAGVREFDAGLEALHPWDRDLRVLPAPRHEEPIWRWMVTDMTFKQLMPMNLPVASMCEEDKDNDEDDRVIINLTATGRIIVGENDVTLAALAGLLAKKSEAYERKLIRRGREPFDESPPGRRWSKLFVLLRADTEAHFQHVQWIVGEISRARIYRLQFGARRSAERNYTQAEAERLWAAWGIYGESVLLDGKLQCFLPTVPDSADTGYLDVRIEGSPQRWSLEDRSTSDPKVLATWIQTAYGKRGRQRTVGRIRAASHTPFGEVVAALNAFHLARLELIDLRGVHRAPEEIRRAKRLPR